MRRFESKIILTSLAFVVTVALWPRGEWLGLAFLTCVLAGAGCGMNTHWGRVARAVLRVEIFMLGIAGFAVFQKGGVWLALNLLAKANLCVAAMSVMGQRVAFMKFLDTLRGWGAPDAMLLPMALLERYRGVLGREWQRLRGARQSRTFAERGWRGRAVVDCLGALLARSLSRAERIAGAMQARGWR